MKLNFPVCILIIATGLVSCADTKQEEASVPEYNKTIATPATVKQSIPDSLTLKSLMQPASVKSLPGLPEDASQNYNAAASISARLNPAHGQPGHRCDIAVGAPLDSKPLQPAAASNAVPTTVTPALPPAIVSQPDLQKVVPGMNPPHGQPNHRCDIAVGAPLNSKPATNNTSPTIVSTPAPVQKVAPGMNPPHGQAGHRCDIAVGAPLNSKPATPAVIAPAPTVTTEPAKPDSSNN